MNDAVSIYTGALSRYADFSGRTARRPFWILFLVNFVIGVVLQILGRATTLFTIVALLYALVWLVPNLAIGVRRLHDTNRSGWWLLIALVPLAGAIVLIVFFATAGDSGSNQHGSVPNPNAA
jgi:uncharacterized membrane protein YhaH (DUF805 family)